jgi:hypothetical protein
VRRQMMAVRFAPVHHDGPISPAARSPTDTSWNVLERRCKNFLYWYEETTWLRWRFERFSIADPEDSPAFQA